MRKRNEVILLLSLLFYGIVTAAGLLIAYFRTGTLAIPLGTAPGKSLAAAVCVAAPIILFSRLTMRRFRWARAITDEFADLLGPLSWKEIFFLAALSGWAEEILFRGALLPWIGYSASSLLFGIVHFRLPPIFLAWTVFATVMGFLLGGSFLWTGDMLAPILIHFLVNFFNLSSIVRRKAGIEGKLSAEG